MRWFFLLMISLAACQTNKLNNTETENDTYHIPNKEISDIFLLHYFTANIIISKSICPENMIHIKRDTYDFCIDQYEIPNKKGAKPYFAQVASQVENFCKTEGKELASRIQWRLACIGPEKQPYPYGPFYQRGLCNDNKVPYISVPWEKMATPEWSEVTQRLFKGNPSGSLSKCKTSEEVYDMIGNVMEIVRDPESSYGYVGVGGFWYGAYNSIPSCNFINPAHDLKKFATYEAGGRCVIDLSKK